MSSPALSDLTNTIKQREGSTGNKPNGSSQSVNMDPPSLHTSQLSASTAYSDSEFIASGLSEAPVDPDAHTALQHVRDAEQRFQAAVAKLHEERLREQQRQDQIKQQQAKLANAAAKARLSNHSKNKASIEAAALAAKASVGDTSTPYSSFAKFTKRPHSGSSSPIRPRPNTAVPAPEVSLDFKSLPPGQRGSIEWRRKRGEAEKQRLKLQHVAHGSEEIAELLKQQREKRDRDLKEQKKAAIMAERKVADELKRLQTETRARLASEVDAIRKQAASSPSKQASKRSESARTLPPNDDLISVFLAPSASTDPALAQSTAPTQSIAPILTPSELETSPAADHHAMQPSMMPTLATTSDHELPPIFGFYNNKNHAPESNVISIIPKSSIDGVRVSTVSDVISLNASSSAAPVVDPPSKAQFSRVSAPVSSAAASAAQMQTRELAARLSALLASLPPNEASALLSRSGSVASSLSTSSSQPATSQTVSKLSKPSASVAKRSTAPVKRPVSKPSSVVAKTVPPKPLHRPVSAKDVELHSTSALIVAESEPEAPLESDSSLLSDSTTSIDSAPSELTNPAAQLLQLQSIISSLPERLAMIIAKQSASTVPPAPATASAPAPAPLFDSNHREQWASDGAQLAANAAAERQAKQRIQEIEDAELEAAAEFARSRAVDEPSAKSVEPDHPLLDAQLEKIESFFARERARLSSEIASSASAAIDAASTATQAARSAADAANQAAAAVVSATKPVPVAPVVASRPRMTSDSAVNTSNAPSPALSSNQVVSASTSPMILSTPAMTQPPAIRAPSVSTNSAPSSQPNDELPASIIAVSLQQNVAIQARALLDADRVVTLTAAKCADKTQASVAKAASSFAQSSISSPVKASSVASVAETKSDIKKPGLLAQFATLVRNGIDRKSFDRPNTAPASASYTRAQATAQARSVWQKEVELASQHLDAVDVARAEPASLRMARQNAIDDQPDVISTPANHSVHQNSAVAAFLKYRSRSSAAHTASTTSTSTLTFNNFVSSVLPSKLENVPRHQTAASASDSENYDNESFSDQSDHREVAAIERFEPHVTQLPAFSVPEISHVSASHFAAPPESNAKTSADRAAAVLAAAASVVQAPSIPVAHAFSNVHASDPYFNFEEVDESHDGLESPRSLQRQLLNEISLLEKFEATRVQLVQLEDARVLARARSQAAAVASDTALILARQHEAIDSANKVNEMQRQMYQEAVQTHQTQLSNWQTLNANVSEGLHHLQSQQNALQSVQVPQHGAPVQQHQAQSQQHLPKLNLAGIGAGSVASFIRQHGPLPSAHESSSTFGSSTYGTSAALTTAHSWKPEARPQQSGELEYSQHFDDSTVAPSPIAKSAHHQFPSGNSYALVQQHRDGPISQHVDVSDDAISDHVSFASESNSARSSIVDSARSVSFSQVLHESQPARRIDTSYDAIDDEVAAVPSTPSPLNAAKFARPASRHGSRPSPAALNRSALDESVHDSSYSMSFSQSAVAPSHPVPAAPNRSPSSSSSYVSASDDVSDDISIGGAKPVSNNAAAVAKSTISSSMVHAADSFSESYSLNDSAFESSSAAFVRDSQQQRLQNTAATAQVRTIQQPPIHEPELESDDVIRNFQQQLSLLDSRAAAADQKLSAKLAYVNQKYSDDESKAVPTRERLRLACAREHAEIQKSRADIAAAMHRHSKFLFEQRHRLRQAHRQAEKYANKLRTGDFSSGINESAASTSTEVSVLSSSDLDESVHAVHQSVPLPQLPQSQSAPVSLPDSRALLLSGGSEPLSREAIAAAYEYQLSSAIANAHQGAGVDAAAQARVARMEAELDRLRRALIDEQTLQRQEHAFEQQKRQLETLIADRERALVVEKRGLALQSAERDVQRLRNRLESLEQSSVVGVAQQPALPIASGNVSEQALVTLAAALAAQSSKERDEALASAVANAVERALQGRTIPSSSAVVSTAPANQPVAQTALTSPAHDSIRSWVEVSGTSTDTSHSAEVDFSDEPSVRKPAVPVRSDSAASSVTISATDSDQADSDAEINISGSELMKRAREEAERAMNTSQQLAHHSSFSKHLQPDTVLSPSSHYAVDYSLASSDEPSHKTSFFEDDDQTYLASPIRQGDVVHGVVPSHLYSPIDAFDSITEEIEDETAGFEPHESSIDDVAPQRSVSITPTFQQYDVSASLSDRVASDSINSDSRIPSTSAFVVTMPQVQTLTASTSDDDLADTSYEQASFDELPPAVEATKQPEQSQLSDSYTSNSFVETSQPLADPVAAAAAAAPLSLPVQVPAPNAHVNISIDESYASISEDVSFVMSPEPVKPRSPLHLIITEPEITPRGQPVQPEYVSPPRHLASAMAAVERAQSISDEQFIENSGIAEMKTTQPEQTEHDEYNDSYLSDSFTSLPESPVHSRGVTPTAAGSGIDTLFDFALSSPSHTASPAKVVVEAEPAPSLFQPSSLGNLPALSIQIPQFKTVHDFADEDDFVNESIASAYGSITSPVKQTRVIFAENTPRIREFYIDEVIGDFPVRHQRSGPLRSCMAGSRLAANVSPMHIVPAVSFSEAEIPEDDIPEEYIPETIAEPEQQPEPVLVPVSDPDASASDRETRRQQKWQRLNVAATHIMNAVLVGGPPSPQMPSPPAIASDGVFASRLSLHVDEHPASPHSPSNGHSPINLAAAAAAAVQSPPIVFREDVWVDVKPPSSPSSLRSPLQSPLTSPMHSPQQLNPFSSTHSLSPHIGSERPSTHTLIDDEDQSISLADGDISMDSEISIGVDRQVSPGRYFTPMGPSSPSRVHAPHSPLLSPTLSSSSAGSPIATSPRLRQLDQDTPSSPESLQSPNASSPTQSVFSVVAQAAAASPDHSALVLTDSDSTYSKATVDRSDQHIRAYLTHLTSFTEVIISKIDCDESEWCIPGPPPPPSGISEYQCADSDELLAPNAILNELWFVAAETHFDSTTSASQRAFHHFIFETFHEMLIELRRRAVAQKSKVTKPIRLGAGGSLAAAFWRVPTPQMLIDTISKRVLTSNVTHFADQVRLSVSLATTNRSLEPQIIDDVEAMLHTDLRNMEGDFLDIGQAEQSVLRELANRLADDILSDSAAAIVRLLERKESRLH